MCDSFIFTRQQQGGYCPKALWPCLPTVCVVVCCSVLQCVAVFCSVWQAAAGGVLLEGAVALPPDGVCYSALQCVAVRCSALQCCNVLQAAAERVILVSMPSDGLCCSLLQCVAVFWQCGRQQHGGYCPKVLWPCLPTVYGTVCCSVLQCVAVHSSVFAVCCSVLQCVVGRSRGDSARRHRAPAPRRSVLHVLHVLYCITVCCRQQHAPPPTVCVAICCTVLQAPTEDQTIKSFLLHPTGGMATS